MAYSGQLVLRLDPEVHGQLAELAERRSMSLNALIDAAVRKALWLDVQERLGMRTESEPATVMIKVAEERPSALEKARKMVESRERGAKKRTEHQAAIRVTARKRVAEVKKRAAERKAASATSLDKARGTSRTSCANCAPPRKKRSRLNEMRGGSRGSKDLGGTPQLDCRPGGRVAAGPTERQRPSEKGFRGSVDFSYPGFRITGSELCSGGDRAKFALTAIKKLFAALSFTSCAINRGHLIRGVVALVGLVKRRDDERTFLAGRINGRNWKSLARGFHVLLRSINGCRLVALVLAENSRCRCYHTTISPAGRKLRYPPTAACTAGGRVEREPGESSWARRRPPRRPGVRDRGTAVPGDGEPNGSRQDRITLRPENGPEKHGQTNDNPQCRQAVMDGSEAR